MQLEVNSTMSIGTNIHMKEFTKSSVFKLGTSLVSTNKKVKDRQNELQKKNLRSSQTLILI